jgi:beta-glucosidase
MRFGAVACLVTLAVSCVDALTPRERAQALLKQMTLDEKLTLVHGVQGPYVGNTPAIDRLGIPALTLEDGPQGVADGVKLTTCWPSALTVAASFDTDLMRQYGVALGEEQKIKGTNIMLGPMVNVARVPYHGRGFEGFGEDPVLSAAMAREYVIGVQSNGIMATAKHFINNHQETNRFTVSANLSMRAEHELYLVPFKAAVDAGVAAIMCSYNKINNTWACENEVTLNQLLRKELGFQGYVMSDWGATHSTIQSAQSGLDQEMADDKYYGNALRTAIQNGQVSMDVLNGMVLNILTAVYQVGIMDRKPAGNLNIDSRSAEHTTLASQLSEQSAVLLKNDNNALPLSSSIKTLAVLGNGAKNPTIAGGGSGHVNADTVSTPYDALSKVVSVTTDLSAADAAVIFVGTTSSEGSDRASLALADDDNKLITNAVAQMKAAKKPVIVVLQTVGATILPWNDQVDAIVSVFMAGQQHGDAITKVLFGQVNPSGKLPITFPKSEDQIGFTQIQYPGINLETEYTEELLVGYRWYNAKNIEPLYPFGHGLSYTQFKYDKLDVKLADPDTLLVSMVASNVGKVAGAAVPQVYVTFPVEADEPPMQLKAFSKINLAAGESKPVVMLVSLREQLSVWHDQWMFIEGDYHIAAGDSSRDLPLSATIRLASPKIL